MLTRAPQATTLVLFEMKQSRLPQLFALGQRLERPLKSSRLTQRRTAKCASRSPSGDRAPFGRPGHLAAKTVARIHRPSGAQMRYSFVYGRRNASPVSHQHGGQTSCRCGHAHQGQRHRSQCRAVWYECQRCTRSVSPSDAHGRARCVGLLQRPSRSYSCRMERRRRSDRSVFAAHGATPPLIEREGERASRTLV